MNIKDIAREVFVLFKKRTDGANADVREIAIGNVRSFHFQNKVSIEDLAEAFQLLQLRNLIMPSTNTPTYYMLTSLGNSCEPSDIFEKIVDRGFISQLSEIIDAELVRGCLDKGYEDAITSAFRILEVRVRTRINAGPDRIGTELMDDAFNPDRGKLVFGETASERQAVHQVFRSAYMMLRNPPSHRYLEEFGGAEIVEIVMFVDFLLKILGKATDRVTT